MAIAAALLVSVLACGTQPPPVGAPGFARILYLHGGPSVDPALLARVRELGFTGVGGGSFAAGMVSAAGLQFYVDQAVGKGVLELSDPAWQQVRERYQTTRDPADLVRPRCLAQVETMSELEAALRERLQQYAAADPWAVSLGDEISVTRHANPLDLCFAAPSLSAFRAFLQQRYASILELNGAWGTSFGSFERVVPMTADQIRAREDLATRLPRNLAPWAEHRAFMDAELARVVHRLVGLTRLAQPRQRVGLTGLQPPSAYGGHDYARLLPELTFFEAYDIGGARELAASMAPEHAAQVVTLFPGAATAPPRLAEAACYDALARGMHGVVVWSAGEVFAADGAATAYGELLERVFREMAPVAERFARARVQRSAVWIVESQASVRAHWMLDSAGDGETWIQRRSSYEAQHSTSLAGRHGWLRLLQDLGLQPLFVAQDDLSVALQRQPPRLLVLPVQLAMSDAAAAAIRGFVEAGGTVVADHGACFYDERLRLRDAPALDPLFGIVRPPLRREQLFVQQGVATGARLPSGAAVAEAELRAAVAQRVGDLLVHAEHRHGRGCAIYLNLAVCEYGRFRLDAAALPAARDLRAHVRGVLVKAGVVPPVDVRADGLPACIEQVSLRAADGGQLLAVRVNALENAALMDQLGQRGPRDVTLTFPRPLGVRDLSTGVEHPVAERLSLPLDPWRGLFLEVRPGR